MGQRVLIVDDSPFIRMMIKNVLTANGHEVVGEAGDGRAAIEMYARLKPDVVTLDLVMPILDGLGALKALRSADPLAKIIMMTAEGQASFAHEAVTAGAIGYIVKPFKDKALLDALRGAATGPK